MWLTEEDIRRITKKVRPSAQLRKLRALGIECRPDGDGKPLVLESVAKRWGGERPERAKQIQEPNFGALRHHGTPA